MNKPVIKFTQLFINGKFVDSKSGKTFPTVDPTNEEVICDISEACPEDVDLAVEAAKKAFTPGSPWRSMDASERGQLLFKLADAMNEEKEYLASLDTLDNGKPYKDGLEDVEGSIATLKYYAGYADKIHGKTIPTDGNHFTYTRKEPVGIVGQIIPWNYPVAMVSWKWGPALATGCVVILKPAEQTPLSALYMAHLASKVGYPKGVINVLPGYGCNAGAAISKHPLIDKVAFTGSTETGKLIISASGSSNLKRFSLELGGKSPIVVSSKCKSVDEAVKICHDAIFANHGQNCCAGSRTYVHASIYDEFVQKASKLASKRVVGDPWAEQTDQGPQIDERQMNKILNLIQSGIKEGANLETGGSKAGKLGYFVQPTVFSGVKESMRIAKEEIFGPVQSIFKFETLNEAIDKANETEYGLAAGILTQDIDEMSLFAQSVRAGSIWVNCYDIVLAQTPFGGFKMSGMGRELGPDGLNEYLETKTVTISQSIKIS